MSNAFTVRKQANGLYRWTAISSTNARDRDGEIVSNQALEMDVYRTKQYGDDSKLRLFHIPYDLGGAPDFRAVVDGCLVETGEFYPTQIASDVAKYIERHPEGTDNTGWGVSIRFKGYPDLDGVYDLIRTKERSPLPSSEAANLWTSINVMEVDMPLEPRQVEFLKMMAQDPEARDAALAIIQAADTSKVIDQAGVQRKSANQPTPNAARFFPLFTEPGRYEAKPADQQKSTEGAAEAAQDAVAATQEAQTTVETAAAVVAEVATEAAAATSETPAAEVVKAHDPVQTAAGEEKKPEEVSKSLSDEDLQQISKFVDDRIKAAMGEMKTQMNAVNEGVQKMLKITADEEVVKAHNELPRQSLTDRLKEISASRSTVTLIDEADDLVQKGKLPEAPTGDGGKVKNRFGFAGEKP